MTNENNSKILIVDDSAFMRTILKDIFLANGFTELREASNGAEAIEVFKKEKPDLVTLDVIMPGMDGLESLKKILNLDSQAKVIMVSTVGQESVVKGAIGIGAKGYVIKPFDPSSIAKIINDIFKS